jgi:hypothetical protein
VTPTVMGQKLEEILRACKELLHRSKHPNPDDTHDQHDNTNGQGYTRFEIIVRDSAHKGDQQEENKKYRFWKDWTIADRIQMVLAITTTGAVLSGVWSNIQTRALVKTAQQTYETTNRPYVGLNLITPTPFRQESELPPFQNPIDPPHPMR